MNLTPPGYQELMGSLPSWAGAIESHAIIDSVNSNKTIQWMNAELSKLSNNSTIQVFPSSKTSTFSLEESRSPAKKKKTTVYAVFREQQLNRAGCLSADSFAVALDQKHSWPEQGPMNKSAPWLGGYSPVKKIWKIHVHSGFFIDFP